MSDLDLTQFDTVSNSNSNSNGAITIDTVIPFGDMAIDLPDGKHRVRITDAAFKITSKGTPAINLQLQVEEGTAHDGIVRWTMFVLTERAARIVARQYKAITGNKLGSMTPAQMIQELNGRTAVADFRTKTDENGVDTQEVRGIYPDNSSKPVETFDFEI